MYTWEPTSLAATRGINGFDQLARKYCITLRQNKTRFWKGPCIIAVYFDETIFFHMLKSAGQKYKHTSSSARFPIELLSSRTWEFIPGPGKDMGIYIRTWPNAPLFPPTHAKASWPLRPMPRLQGAAEEHHLKHMLAGRQVDGRGGSLCGWLPNTCWCSGKEGPLKGNHKAWFIRCMDEIHFAPRNETVVETIRFVGIYTRIIRNQGF